MKRLLSMAMLLVLAFAVQISADVPTALSYQGVLADAGGVAVPDNTYSITFKIYNVESGGSPLWEETKSVQVTKGVFNAILGTQTSLAGLLFNEPYYLGVSVAGGAELPRQLLTAVPYSLNSRNTRGALNVFPSSGNVGIGTLNPPSALYISQNVNGTAGITIENMNTGSSSCERLDFTDENGTLAGIACYDNENPQYGSSMNIFNNRPNGYLSFLTGGVVRATVDNSGNLGVGIATPAQKLDVAGGLRLGNTSGAAAGSMRWTGSDFEGYDGAAWKSFTATGGGGLPSGTSGQTLRHDGANWVATSALYNNGMKVGIGVTGPVEKFEVDAGTTRGYMGGSNYGVYGRHFMTNAYGYLGGSSVGGGGYSLSYHGLEGFTERGYGVYGACAGTNGTAVMGQHANTNEGYLGGRYYAVYGRSANDTSYAGYFNGRIHLTGFELPTGAGAGKVLTSDATGVGTWATPPSGIGGSGTANYIPKFTAGSTLGNSSIYQTGASIGVHTTNPQSDLDINGMCRVIGVNWPSAGKGMELGYNPGINRGYIQVYDRTAPGAWGNLYFGDTKVGIGIAPPEAQLHVKNNTDGTFAKIADDSHGVWGENTTSGNKGYVAGAGYGLYGESQNVAIHGANPAPGNSTYGQLGGTDFGAFGRCDGSFTTYAYLGYGTAGVYAYSSPHGEEAWLAAEGYAGYFDGTTVVTGNLSKGGGSFRIDHPLDPENKYLLHSFVESPDMMNVYNGNVALDAKGEAVVQLPEWFEALNKDFRYQLTCIGGFAPVYVAEKVSGNKFKIAGGTAGLEVSWQVTGIRQDAWANAHRIPVEQDKSAKARGKYLHPVEHGQPPSKGINYGATTSPGE